ncbi:MAG: ACT domain-containing protein [Vulcanisaeta sp.]|nr:ACT domain-containing protein [Vulcanisaeta sp.]MCG2879923.1 ACT domain-containing protein [Vulcanisaeta sp.]MCG2894849.1 ACT domain-containing protein [Vulcanisaeta sp.]
MEVLYRDLALSFEGRDKVLGEFLIKFTADRPGILAALSNVFADHGINILNISVNRNQLLLHFIVDLTNTDTSLNDLEKEFKKFSFVEWVRYRVVEREAFMVPSMIMPTFMDRQVLILELDRVKDLLSNENFRRLIRNLGASDASALRNSNISELVKIGQFRGLGRVMLVERDGVITIRSCSELGDKHVIGELMIEYYVGFLSQALGREVEVAGRSYEGDCVSVSFRVLK